MSDTHDGTLLLAEGAKGNEGALDDRTALMYREFRQLAASEKNSRATPCKQQCSASLAWSWDEPVPMEFFRFLVLLRLAKMEGKKARAAPSTVGRGVTRSTAVGMIQRFVSTGSRVRRQRQQREQSEISD